MRCEHCPVLALERAMNSQAGQLVSAAIQLDSDIDCGIPPDLNETSARLYSVLRILRNEKARYQDQQRERDHDGRPPIHNRSR